MQESDNELLERYERVRLLIEEETKRMNRLSGKRRLDKAKWVGCLTFTLCDIKSELKDRHLLES